LTARKVDCLSHVFLRQTTARPARDPRHAGHSESKDTLVGLRPLASVNLTLE